MIDVSNDFYFNVKHKFFKKMKKVNVFMMAALFAASAMFVSCNKDDEGPDIGVTLNNSARTSITVATNKKVDMEITWEAPAGIKEITLTRNGDLVSPYNPKTSSFRPSDECEKYSVEVKSPGTKGGTVTYVAKLTDKNGEWASQTITITFEDGGGDTTPTTENCNTWANLVLGSLEHLDTKGSSCASIDGSVYLIGQARINSAKVDFIYSNQSDSHTLSSPNSTFHDAMDTGWGTKNKTKIQKLDISATKFDTITTNDELVANVPNISSESVTDLEAGNIIGFITSGGKRGMIKINSVNSPANHINITIKVQK